MEVPCHWLYVWTHMHDIYFLWPSLCPIAGLYTILRYQTGTRRSLGIPCCAMKSLICFWWRNSFAVASCPAKLVTNLNIPWMNSIDLKMTPESEWKFQLEIIYKPVHSHLQRWSSCLWPSFHHATRKGTAKQSRWIQTNMIKLVTRSHHWQDNSFHPASFEPPSCSSFNASSTSDWSAPSSTKWLTKHVRSAPSRQSTFQDAEFTESKAEHRDIRVWIAILRLGPTIQNSMNT